MTEKNGLSSNIQLVKVTIIIATKDITTEPFTRCLKAIRDFTKGEYRIVVVETHFSSFFNHSTAMNIGLRGTRDSDYFVLMNDDLFVTTGWLETLIKTAEANEKIGAVGCLHLYSNREREGMVQYAGGYIDTSRGLVAQARVEHRYHFEKVTKEIMDEEWDVPFLTGSLILIKRKCLENVGLWDEEKFGFNFNDVDWSFRAILKGWRLIYTSKALVYHFEGNSILKIPEPIWRDYLKQTILSATRKWTKERMNEVKAIVDKYNLEHRGKLPPNRTPEEVRDEKWYRTYRYPC